MSASLLVVNIGQLLTLPAGGADRLGVTRRAAVLIRDGRVAFAGPSDALGAEQRRGAATLDAGGALVTPGLVEPHAHPIFAGSRAGEFALRARGATYIEVQAQGGGILSTVRATAAASDAELCDGARKRLRRLMAHGVTVCEAKSGYALDVEGELRLLRLLRRAADGLAIDLSPTLLAHVVPPGVDRAAYVARFADELVPRAAATEGGRRLAEACDVFCDQGAFTLDETRRILTAARAAGMALRVHAEQLSHTGAALLGAELGARSVEHLEHLTDEDIVALARAGTVCTLLPGAALTLRLPFPDARRLLDRGCTVALGTDLTPGSSYSENLPLMMSIACTQMGMHIDEAWLGVTRAAARAVGREDAGHLQPGARGDLVVWNEEDHRELVQHLGMARATRLVIAGGEVPVG